MDAKFMLEFKDSHSMSCEFPLCLSRIKQIRDLISSLPQAVFCCCKWMQLNINNKLMMSVLLLDDSLQGSSGTQASFLDHQGGSKQPLWLSGGAI